MTRKASRMADTPTQRPRHAAQAPGTPQAQKPASRVQARTTARAATSASAGGVTGRVSRRTAQLTDRAGARARARYQGQQLDVRRIIVPAVAALVGLLLVLLLFTLVIIPSCSRSGGSDRPDVPAGQTVVVAVPEGSGGAAIAQTLYDNGIIDSLDAFYKELNKQNAEQYLKSGTYEFVTGSTPAEVVRLLMEGPNLAEGRLTIAEGLTLARTAQQVEASLGIPADEFLAQAKASNYAAEFPFVAGAGDDSLEGFLFPKTYDFAGKEVTADAVIRAMLAQYQVELDVLDLADAEESIRANYGVTMTDYDILKMASIIEREAVTEEDRPLVSSVFYNRLRQSMPLQSDATMTYVVEGEVTAEHLKQDSPYNTYLNAGFPPTPICSPSIESLQAAAHPSATDYLYFLIVERDGYSNHTFSRTYEEHQAAIDQVAQDLA